jgi:hypothetical protein
MLPGLPYKAGPGGLFIFQLFASHGLVMPRFARVSFLPLLYITGGGGELVFILARIWYNLQCSHSLPLGFL